MIAYRISEAKKLFFDKDLVLRQIDQGTAKVLSKFGAFVRTRGRSKLKRPRRKSLSEMNEKERLWYEEQLRLFKQGKRSSKPQRPLASSKPGEPPRNITGDLKNNTFFIYDPASRSVVVGPAKLNKPGHVPADLENGGDHVEPRPWMQPALQEELPGLPAMWRNSVTR